MIPEISLQGLFLWYFVILGLLVLFILPYYLIVRRFFPEISAYIQIIFAFVFSLGAKLLVFGISAVTQFPLRYLFIGESILVVILATILVYHDRKIILPLTKVSKEKILFALLLIFILWASLYLFSYRYDWDALEFYLPYAKLYVTENTLLGYSDEISNYLSLPFLQPTVYGWVFSLVGVQDEATFFLPLINTLMLALVTYEIAKRFLRQEFVWLATALSVLNVLLMRYLLLVPRYIDLPFGVLILVFFFILFSKIPISDNKRYLLSFLILFEAIFTKTSSFSLYLIILLLFIPLFWPRLVNLIDVTTWAGVLFVMYFVFPEAHVAVAKENILVYQVMVVILLILVTILNRIILRFSTKKAPSFKVLSFIILSLIPGLVLLSYEYSLTGQPLFPFVKPDSMKPAMDLLIETSVSSGRIESNPLSILYLTFSSITGPLLPFFGLYVLILGEKIYKGMVKGKDIFELRLLFLMLLLILFDFTIFGSISNRRHIATYIIYLLFSIAGFASIIKGSHNKLKVSSILFFMFSLLFSIWKFGETNLDLQYSALSIDTTLIFIDIGVALTIYYIYSKSKDSVVGSDSEKIPKDTRVTTKVTKTRLAILACFVVLILFPVANHYLNSYLWTNDVSQSEIQEILSKVPEERVLTFAVMGEYYYAGVRPIDLAQVEDLRLIYPEYNNSISTFTNRIKELDIKYAFLPEDGWLAPWFMRIIKDVPVMQLLLSDNFFPIVERSSESGYNLRRFDDITFKGPILVTILAQAERTIVINDRYELERWESIGTSENLTVDISFIIPNKLRSMKSLHIEGRYIVGSYVENLTSDLPYTLTEHFEGFYTLSITLTGSKIEENQIIKISKIDVTLQDEEGKDLTLSLVSNYDKPLTLWYVPRENSWGLEQGTFLLYQELDVNSD